MKKILMLPVIMLVTASAVSAQRAAVYNTNGVALTGYDVVAFFTEKKPVKGDTAFKTNWQDVEWLFSNAAHRDAFKADPEKYAPQFGGYCAYGTAEGHKAPTETGTWTIVNDKLYFNYNKSVQKGWLKDQQHLIEKANAQWPSIKDKEETVRQTAPGHSCQLKLSAFIQMVTLYFLKEN